MATIIIKGYVVGRHYDFSQPGEVHWYFQTYDNGENDTDCVHRFPHQISIEVPDSVNIVAAQVKKLEAAKAKALEDYQNTVAQINERLSKLLAITNEVTA